MNQLNADRLAELVAHALESTAFILCDHTHRDYCAFDPSARGAKISYSGSQAGEITLFGGDEFIRCLASNLLGTSPDEITLETQGTDAMKELANIVGGSIIAELGGQSLPFRLGLPEAAAFASNPPAEDSSVVCCLNCEEQPLLVTWTPARAA